MRLHSEHWKRTVFAFFYLFCVPLFGQEPPRPPELPTPAVASFIGDFVNARDTVILFEENGEVWRYQGGRQTVRLHIVGPRSLALVKDTCSLDERGTILRFPKEQYHRLAATTGTFRIAMQRPIEQLRIEAARAIPPSQSPDLQPPALVELRSLDSTIRYDIRYASENNFMGAVFYSQAKAFLQRSAAEALVKAHRWLNGQGYGLLIHDAYRPWYVTKMFWDATPVSQRDFVANPSKGSKHNRGCAVDLSLYDLAAGQSVEMPSGYDEFSHRAYPNYPGGTARQRWYRQLLRTAMEREGFQVERVEWWHFDYGDWRQYPVMNVPFEDIAEL